MPRRMINSAMSTDEKLARLSFKAQFLWPWLIPHCSDQGRLLADPLKIKLIVVPGVNDITWQDIEAILQEYVHAGMAILYAANNVAIIQIVNWWKHQHLQWAYPDSLPAPDGWHDHLRYRKDGKVITDNWLDDDSQALPDVVPSEAPPLPNALGKEIGNGQPSAQVSHRSSSRSSINSNGSIKGEEPPAREAAPETSSPHAPRPVDHDPVDPRDRKHHKLPQAPFSAAVNAYLEACNAYGRPQSASPAVSKVIDGAIAAEMIPKWRVAVEEWLLKGYNPANVSGLLDFFTHGNGQGRDEPSFRRRKDGRRESVYTEEELEAARAADKGHKWTPPPDEPARAGASP